MICAFNTRISFWDYHCNVACVFFLFGRLLRLTVCVVPENVSSKLDNSQVWTLK